MGVCRLARGGADEGGGAVTVPTVRIDTYGLRNQQIVLEPVRLSVRLYRNSEPREI